MSKILKLWKGVVSDTERFQVMEGDGLGLVMNPIINSYYLRETAFAAKIFATEWRITARQEYLDRCNLSLDALKKYFNEHSVTKGINEPTLMPRGLRYRNGSIPATILLLYAATDASNLIGEKFIFDDAGVCSYLSQCHIGGGRYYHDIIKEDIKYQATHIINTSAMAFFYISSLSRKSEKTADLQKRSEIINAIIKAQRSDGLWPYLEANYAQRFMFSLRSIMPEKLLKIYNIVLGDRSIFFCDAVHHCITLYYFIKGLVDGPGGLKKHERKSIEDGWVFLREKLVEYKKDYIRFDFSWEPAPRYYRHCNFIDTSTYFYILDLLILLKYGSIITWQEAHYLSNGITNHIYDNLRSGDGSIDAYEGKNEIVEMIMPRPSESIFDKGFFFSNTVLMLREKL